MSSPSINFISAGEFLKIIRFNYYGHVSHGNFYKSTNEIVFENICVKENIVVTEIVKIFSCKFINCEFENIQFKYINATDFIFTNTTIEKLNFEGINISNFKLDKTCEVTEQLNILNSWFSQIDINCDLKSLIIKGHNKNQNIKLTLNRNVGTLSIQDAFDLVISCFGEISFCYLKKSKYPFSSFVTIKKLLVQECTNIGIISGIFENIDIVHCNSFDFINLICINNLTIRNSISPEKLLNFINIYVGNSLLLDDINIGVSFTINENVQPFMFINKLKVHNGLHNILLINSEEDTLFHINSIEFKNFSFSKDAIWKLEKLVCSDILFYNFRNFGSGNIDNTKGGYFEPSPNNFNEWVNIDKELKGRYVDYFNDAQNINCSLKKDKTLTFRQSDFGKLNFINTDFSDFKLSFYSTKLNEIFLAGSKMPKKVDALNEAPDPFHQRRIANSQLKKLHEQQGDIVAANEYFANEMNAYYSSLRWETQFWEKLHLWLNKISSNHGQSWIRALTMTLIISIIFYCLFCISLGFGFANPLESKNWNTFWKLTSYYLEFINPVHKLDNFKGLRIENEISSFARLFDGISRLINSYFIYQLIQAFRKHGRSK